MCFQEMRVVARDGQDKGENVSDFDLLLIHLKFTQCRRLLTSKDTKGMNSAFFYCNTPISNNFLKLTII